MQSTVANIDNPKDRNKSFLLVGIAATMAYVLAEFIGGYYTPGYNYLDNTASELMAIGAADREFYAPFYCLHAILIGLFGVGLIRTYSYDCNQSLYTGGILLIIIGSSYTLASSIFPMDPPDTAYSTSGYMHIILIGIGALSLLFSIPTITQGVYIAYNWRMFKKYTWMVLPLLFICGILSPIILYADIALMGLAERIIGYFSSFWLVALSYGLLKQFSSEVSNPTETIESDRSFSLVNDKSKSDQPTVY